MATQKGFTHPDTAKRYKPAGENFNWNRTVNIAGGWSGPIKSIPPDAVEAYISKGRRDIVPIEQPKKGKELVVDPPAGEGNNVTK